MENSQALYNMWFGLYKMQTWSCSENFSPDNIVNKEVNEAKIL